MSITTVPAAGQYGAIYDALPQELPINAWSSVQNIRFRDGCAERFRGSAQVFTSPSVTPYYLTPYRSLNSKFWVHAGLARVYSDDGAVRTDLTPATPYTGAIDDRWSGGSAQGVLVINNGVDQPQFWGGNVATKFAPLTAWNAAWRCASLRPFKNYLIALDVTKSGTRYGSMVKWSSAASPGSLPASWDETDATKDAGEQDLAETSDLLVDQLQLGDVNVIYKERSMYGMQYIGAPFIWRFYRLPGDVGMLARGCGASTPKGHVILTAGDVILHTGQGPQSIVTARMRKWLFNTIDTALFSRAFVTASPATSEVWICFPETGQATCTLALVWNWNDDTFTTRQLSSVTYGAPGMALFSGTSSWATDPDIWSNDATTWSNDGFGVSETRLLTCNTAPGIWAMESGAAFNGVNPICILERTGIAFDAPDVVKTIKSITPRIEASPGTVLSFQLGASMDAEVAPTWGAAVSYTVGTTRKVDSFATGRFLSLRITSTSAALWRLKSFDCDVQAHGRY